MSEKERGNGGEEVRETLRQAGRQAGRQVVRKVGKQTDGQSGCAKERESVCACLFG